MRKFLFWILNAAALGSFLYGCRFFIRAWDFYEGAAEHFVWARYQLVCSSPDESPDCAGLADAEPAWDNDVVLTDPEVLHTIASYFQDFAVAFFTLGSFFVGMSGVILGASAIVIGQARTRPEPPSA